MAFYYNPHHGAASTSHEVMSPAYVLRADCANYPTWSIRMKLMLCQKEVWGVVGGGISVESDGFSIKDEKAKGLIGALVDEMLMHVVADAGSSKEAWERLEGMSKSAAPTYERELRRNLANFGEHAGKAVGELLGLMTMLRRELGALGVELSEPEYVHALFEALPDDFAAAEQAWIAGGGVAGIESIQSMLLAIERQVGRRKGAAIGGAHERSLFAGQTDAQRSNVRRAKFDGSCWDCGKSGHTRRNCTRRARGNATATEEEGGTKSNEIAMFALNTVKRSYADAVRGGKRLWILDSGASAHMTGCVQLLSNVRPCNHKIRTANNGEMEATAAGDAQVEGLHLRNVLYVPGLALDLISIPKLAAEGAKVMFEEGKCLVEDKGETTVSTLRDGLYALSAKDHSPMSAGGISSQLLHERLCHPYDRSLPCEICILAKSTRRSFPPNDSRASVPLEVLHSDVLEVTPRGAKGERYLVTLVDDATGLSACTPIHRKSQTGAVLMAMVSMMETACKQQTKTLRTDRGTEYMNFAVREWAAARDISLRPSPAYVPEMNGRAERFNRTLLEKVRAVVLAKNISKDLWPELAPAVCYVLNRSMNSRGQIPIAVACGESSSTEHLRVLGSPAYVFEPGPEKLDARAQKGVLVGYGKRHKVYRILLNGSVREVTNVRIQEKERFAETMVGPPGIDILSDESEPLHEETNGNQTSQIEEGPHTVEREDVEPATNEWTFEEDLSLASGLHALGWGEWNRIVARDELRGRSAIDAERRAEVLGITHDNAAEILNDLFPGQSALVAELITDKITLNSKAASQAVKRELDAVMSMHVFDPKKVVEFREASTDPSAQFVRGKMIVARKNVEQDTSQQLLKARLVAQGCVLFNGSGHLVRDDDFQYERPIGLRSSRYVLAHGRAAGDLAKFDVDSAYLSADLRGPRTYLELPESVRPDAWAGFERPVVPLQKALPGLPRSGADFGAEARRRLTERGWHQTQSDMNLYHKVFESADVLLALYVDDGLLAGDISALGFAIQEMLELFKISKPVQRISENGRVDFLGMRVRAENQNEWVLDSADYCALFVKDAMKKLGYKEVGKHRIARKVHTPLHDEVVEPATASDSTCCEPWVRSLIGQLMWLARAGRPDVAHAAAWIARHVDAWNDAAAMALDRTVRYLAWHTNLGIPFKRPQVTTKQGLSMAQVDAYSDADYAGCLKTRKSTSGFLVFARVGEVDYLIDWHSSRQRACSTSTTESELAALTHTVKLGVMPILLLQEHMRKQARESCHAKPLTPIVRCDNEAAVASVKKGWSDKLLHMTKTHGVELAWLHELTEQTKNLLLMRVGTKQNTADMMTKALSADKFGLHRGRILCVAASSEGACDDIAVRPNGETGSGSVLVTRAPQPVGLDGDAPLGQLVRPTAKTREGARPLTSTRATPPQGRARTAEAKCSPAALFKRQPPLAWRLGTT